MTSPPTRRSGPSRESQDRHNVEVATTDTASIAPDSQSGNQASRNVDPALPGAPALPMTGLARRILNRCPRPLPRYGSDEWAALPKDDLRRFGSVLLAAECWRDHCSPQRIAADLIEGFRSEDRAVLARLRGASADVRNALAETLPGWVGSPSHAELARRRAEPSGVVWEATQRRIGGAA